MNVLRIVLLSFLGLLLFSCKEDSKRKEAIKKRPPNIVFIMSDDHAQRAISSYDGSLNQTPNIDRIATEGAIFTNSFVTNSICGPSRAAFITGKFSHKNGYLANYRSKFDGSQTTLPKLLKANGYTTSLIGKWHLGTNPTGFDHWNIVNDQGDYYNPEFISGMDTIVQQGYVTNQITEQAIDWMQHKRDTLKPFLLMVHHKAPHRNWMPDTTKLGMYDGKEFPLPPNFKGDFSNRGPVSESADMGIWKTMTWSHDLKITDLPENWKHYKADEPYHTEKYIEEELGRMNPEQKKAFLAYYDKKNKELLDALDAGMTLDAHIKWRFNRYMQDYLSTVSSVDDSVGELLDYLKNAGLEDNTIVVYTSDQGFYLGENGWFDKRFMYEPSMRTPMLMKYPGHIAPNTKVKQMVQNIDFAPSMLEWAGIAIPEEIQGLSYVKLFKNSEANWREAIYYHYYMYPGTHSVKRQYGVRTDRYKLIHFYSGIDSWELYDLQKDPNELENLYDNPSFKNIQEQMHQVLVKKQQEYGDSHELALDYLENNKW